MAVKTLRILLFAFSGVWLFNQRRKQRFLRWRRPTEWPCDHTLSRLTWFTPDEELSPWGFPPKCRTSFWIIFWAIAASTASWKVKLADYNFRLICSARSPQMKRSRGISFNCSWWIHIFPRDVLTLSNSTMLFLGFWFAEIGISLRLTSAWARNDHATALQAGKKSSYSARPGMTNPLRLHKHHFQ